MRMAVLLKMELLPNELAKENMEELLFQMIQFAKEKLLLDGMIRHGAV